MPFFQAPKTEIKWGGHQWYMPQEWGIYFKLKPRVGVAIKGHCPLYHTLYVYDNIALWYGNSITVVI